MTQYFAQPYEPSGGEVNIKADLSNYAAKADLKNATGVDTISSKIKLSSAKI